MNRGLVGAALAACVAWGCGAGSPGSMTGTGGTSGGSGGNGSGTGGSGGAADAGTGGGAGGSGGVTDAGGDRGSGGQSGTDGGADATDAVDTGPAGDPMLLSQTGLYADVAAGTLAPGVYAFQPQYPLWSDSASKRRWVSIPAGMKIDTSDMDFWDYPSGTKFWKEFTRDGADGKPVRVETRLLMKRSPGDWFAMAFKWNAQLTDAVAVPAGVKTPNTQHDIRPRKTAARATRRCGTSRWGSRRCSFLTTWAAASTSTRSRPWAG